MNFPKIGAHMLVFASAWDYEARIDDILDCVAKAGYAGIEGSFSDPAALREKLDARGLKHGSLHTGPKVLQNPDDLIKAAKTLGSHDICNSGLLQWGQHSLDDWKQTIEILNTAGAKLRDNGINLHYHNHAFEFEPIEGQDFTAMDLLMDELDFNACDFCIDVAWVSRAGLDPAEFLADHADLIGFLHLKDHEGETWREIGNGVIDWHEVIEAIWELPNVEWAMIEQDKTDKDPCESSTMSRNYIRETFGL